MFPRLLAYKIVRKTFASNKFFASDLLDSSHTMQEIFPSFISNNVAPHDHKDTYKIFVGSWNVGGASLPVNMDMQGWFSKLDRPADIYVFGFQEVVPLNIGNVLLYENNRVMNWNSGISLALNNKTSALAEGKIAEFQKVFPMKDDTNNSSVRGDNRQDFECIMSKQMVGVLLTVWIRSDLSQKIMHLSVSSVGCGVMGCLGNKGSVSVRICLNETSFCFVCSHLASGGKEGDERHRNANVDQILSQTIFPRGHFSDLPQKILDHDCVIWLGDMNYRIQLPEDLVRFLVEKREWTTLLEKDELKVELKEGHVFHGWSEGVIDFAPTYKYCPNSEAYFGCHQNGQKSPKRRAPAWCDRIIWFGKGLKQNHYGRGELRLSDHRPVYAIFTYTEQNI